MGIRRQARELALQALYAMDVCGKWSVEEVQFTFQHFQSASGVQKYAEEIVEGVIKELPRIDAQLTTASEHWSLSRMGRVDRALLRVSAYELLFCKDVPTSVVLNEAIEIAKRYGAEDSPTFVNGVLDRIARHLAREAAKPPVSANE